MSQTSPFEESQLARIKALKSALLTSLTRSRNTPQALSESPHSNRIRTRVIQIRHSLPLLASKLPGMPLSKRVIQHNAATLLHPRTNTADDSNGNPFLGLSGAAIDRMSDITPDLVLTITPNDTLRLEGTLTSTSKFEFPTSSLLSRTLIDNINQRRLSKELFEVICRCGGKDTEDPKYRMIEGQFVMGVVDLRRCNLSHLLGESYEAGGAQGAPETGSRFIGGALHDVRQIWALDQKESTIII